MKNYLLMTGLAALLLGSMMTGPALSQERVELGKLDCFVDGGTGFVFGSTKDISCIFEPANPDREVENYFGVINKFGIDIGFTDQSFMSWLVIAPTSGVFQPGALAGDYVGATASATFAVGLGANVLVGGSENSFALQPVSVETQLGLNFAAGVAEVQLRTID